MAHHVNDKRNTAAEVLATYMKMRPDSRLRLAGFRVPPRPQRREPYAETVRQMLIDSGVSPDRIRVGDASNPLEFPLGRRGELPTNEDQPPQVS